MKGEAKRGGSIEAGASGTLRRCLNRLGREVQGFKDCIVWFEGLTAWDCEGYDTWYDVSLWKLDTE